MKYLKIYLKIQLFAFYILFIFVVLTGGWFIGTKLFDILGGYLSLLFTLPIIISSLVFLFDKMMDSIN